MFPELAFPIFPTLPAYDKVDDTSVIVPAEWIVRMAEYKIRIEETEANYRDLKALYNDEI